MKVHAVMTTDNLLTIGEDDSLAAAAHKMTWAHCRHLPVVRNHEVVGVLSERDILAWLGAGNRLDGPTNLVRAAMVAPATVASPDDDLGEVAARMLSYRVGSSLSSSAASWSGWSRAAICWAAIVAEMYTPTPDRG